MPYVLRSMHIGWLLTCLLIYLLRVAFGGFFDPFLLSNFLPGAEVMRVIFGNFNHRMKIQCCVLGARKNRPDFLEFQLLNGYAIVLGRGYRNALEGWEFQSSNRRAEVGAQVGSGYCLHL